jgi:hypothetical protein
VAHQPTDHQSEQSRIAALDGSYLVNMEELYISSLKFGYMGKTYYRNPYDVLYVGISKMRGEICPTRRARI